MGLHNNVVAINNVVSSTGLLVQKKNFKNLFSVKNKVRAKNIIIDFTLIDIKDFITMKVNNSSMFCVFLFSSKFFNVSDWQSWKELILINLADLFFLWMYTLYLKLLWFVWPTVQKHKYIESKANTIQIKN